jgi:hypothetical protein
MTAMSRTLVPIAMVLALPASSAHAQGAGFEFPEPMSSREFAALMRSHAKVTREQWLTLHLLHEDAIGESAALRDGEIETYFAEQARRSGGILSEAVERELLPRRRRINALIAAIDDRLFDRVLLVLGDESRRAIEGARLERECERLERDVQRYALTPFGEGDLTPHVLAVTWSEEEREPARERLLEYQQKLVSLLRSMRDVAPDAANYVPGAPIPLTQERKELVRLKTEVRRAHRQLLDDLDRLTPKGGAKVRAAWTAKRYGRVGASPRPAFPLKAALRVRGLDDESRARLASALEEIESADRTNLRSAIELVDAQQSQMPTPRWSAGGDEQLKELEAKHEAMVRRATELARGVLGQEVCKVVTRRAWNGDFSDPNWSIDIEAPEPARTSDNDSSRGRTLFESMAKGLPWERYLAIGHAAHLDAGQVATLADVHQRCLDEVAKVMANRDRPAAGSAPGPTAGIASPFGVGGAEVHQRVLARREGLERAEAILFDHLASVAEPADQSTVAAARYRRLFEVWTAPSIQTSNVVAQVELPSDPFAAIGRAVGDDALTTKLEAMVVSDASAILDCVRALAKASANADLGPLERAKAEWSARQACHVRYTALRAKLIENVPAALRPRFEAVLLCEANPPLEDWADAGDAISAALTLETLAPEAREGIEKLAAEFAARYLNCCKRMLPDPVPEPETQIDVSRWMTSDSIQERRRGRAAFERSELSAHTITKLRSLLTPEQQDAIPAIDRLDVYVQAK